jgi:sarcosine oxidase subunit gamma
VSAPEITLAACPADIVELAAFRGRAADIERLAGAAGLPLPALGGSALQGNRLTLSVRPGRWLTLTPPAAPGSAAAHWQTQCAGVAAAVDLSGGLRALLLGGSAVREMLVRGCRLDLGADAFPAGSAAATIMVQVPMTLAALEGAMLVLTPATTARHLREWLIETSKPFGLQLSGDRWI